MNGNPNLQYATDPPGSASKAYHQERKRGLLLKLEPEQTGGGFHPN